MDPRRDDELREEICRWLEANGIEYKDVPITARPIIADGQITCPAYLRRDGQRYLEDGKPARGAVTVPLTVPPPASLLFWLGLPSTCPNCGWAGEGR